MSKKKATLSKRYLGRIATRPLSAYGRAMEVLENTNVPPLSDAEKERLRERNEILERLGTKLRPLYLKRKTMSAGRQ